MDGSDNLERVVRGLFYATLVGSRLCGNDTVAFVYKRFAPVNIEELMYKCGARKGIACYEVCHPREGGDPHV